MSVANQRKIVIKRQSDKAQKDYLKVSNTNLNIAMRNLKNNAFKLWIYFVDNADGYIFDLYPVDFCSKTGVADNTYRSAFKELEEKGFLKQSKSSEEEYKNIYFFYECSDNEDLIKPDVVNSVDKDNLEELEKKCFG